MSAQQTVLQRVNHIKSNCSNGYGKTTSKICFITDNALILSMCWSVIIYGIDSCFTGKWLRHSNLVFLSKKFYLLPRKPQLSTHSDTSTTLTANVRPIIMKQQQCESFRITAKQVILWVILERIACY